MANFENLIPFILHFEVGLPTQHLFLPLEKMFAKAKEMKNAYAVVAGDTGGPTMCGVTLSTRRLPPPQGHLHNHHLRPQGDALRRLARHPQGDVLG